MLLELSTIWVTGWGNSTSTGKSWIIPTNCFAGIGKNHSKVLSISNSGVDKLLPLIKISILQYFYVWIIIVQIKIYFLVEDTYNYIGCSTIIGAIYFSFLNTIDFNTVLFNFIVYCTKLPNISKTASLIFMSSCNTNWNKSSGPPKVWQF